MKKIVNNKKAALEMSMGTVVVIVLAVTMLILGLVLVRTIFTGAKYNVEEIDDKVRGEIQKLFQESTRSVVYLANGKADVRQGDEWGVAFAIKNLEEGTTSSSSFTYQTKSLDLSSSCSGLSRERAETWIVARGSGSVSLPPGQSKEFIIRFNIPESAPLCTIPFDIEIKKDGEVYDTASFDIIIKG